MKVLTTVLAAACALTAASAAPVAIRHTDVAPFMDGVRVESAWAKADTMVRFVTCRSLDVALDQSEVQALFDEKNLYVSAKGRFDPDQLNDDATLGLFNGDNFELFVKTEGAATYRQVCAGAREQVYAGIGRAEAKDSGVTCRVQRGKGVWIANVTIPMSFLGISAPVGTLPARFCAMRHNVSTYGRKPEDSSFAPITGWDYGLSELWAEAAFVRGGAPVRHEGLDNGCRVNLFPNPEFNVPGRCWGAASFGQRTETMPLSGEWIWRFAGKGYQILGSQPAGWKPDADYTLVVKARNFGGEGALRAIQLVKNAAGKVVEGGPVAMNIPLGPEFHEYYLPFRTSHDKPVKIILYKLGANEPDQGVEIASVRLFTGRVSAFEIRPITRAGQKVPIAGTEIAPATNPFGRTRRTLRVLALVKARPGFRELSELFAGLNVQVDSLLLSGDDQDVYSTDGDPVAVSERLEKGEYDVYMVPWRVSQKVGKELAGKILSAVKNGAGLYFERNAKPGRFAEALKEANAAEVGTDHFLRQAFPAGAYPPSRPVLNENTDPLAKIEEGRYGRGRVLMMNAAQFFLGYRPGMAYDAYAEDGLPFDALANAWLFRNLLYAANMQPEEGGTPRTRTLVYGGRRIEYGPVVDKDGFSVDWFCRVTPCEGPVLGVYDESAGVVAQAVDGGGEDLKLVWTFEDFSGRVLGKGETAVPAPPFRLPVDRLFTNFGLLRMSLTSRSDVLDRRNHCVFATGNDLARTMEDYTPAIWPASSEFGASAQPAIWRQLADVGIRASIMPSCGTAIPLACGIACGGSYLGGGGIFYGWPQKGNVRKQQYNTKAAHAALAKQAEKNARSGKRYGWVQTAVCDEPNMVHYGRADELDAHPENLAEYRARMEKKYGTIAEYNRRHLTDHHDFSTVGQALLADARKSGRYAEFIEWRNFNVDRWVEAIRILSDGGKRAYPANRMSLYDSFGQTPFSGNDYWKLLTKAGLDHSNEYSAMVYFGANPNYNFDEFYRSFRPDMRMWGFTGYYYSRERAFFMPWWCAAHRYGGFCWYNAASWTFNLVDIPSLAKTVDARDLKDSLSASGLLDGLGKLTLAWDWTSRDVAIYYSHDAMLLSYALGQETKMGEIRDSGPMHDFMYSRQGAQYAVEELLYQHDFVAPEQMSAGALGKCRILLMPRIIAMSDAEVAAVKAFAKGGGTVVADQLPGDYDELGVRRAANPFVADGIVVLGANFSETDLAQRARLRGLLEKAGARPNLVSSGADSLHGREAMRFTDGTSDVHMVIRMLGRSSDKEEETFVFPKRGHVYDVRAGRYIGEADSVTAKVPYGDACVWSVLPARPESLSLEVPETAVRGQDVPVSVSIAGKGRQVFHVEFVAPDGSCRFHMKRNVVASDGVATLRFPMAFNDLPGRWTVKAHDVLTGLATERAFILR